MVRFWASVWTQALAIGPSECLGLRQKPDPTGESSAMLVLSRKKNESIVIDDSIVITVVRVAGDKVRLGIDAPRDMLVLRDELEPHADIDLAGAGSLEIEVAAGELASLARSA